MAEEVSPESKLYVKEEIEKMRKEFKEDLEKAQSRATKTFATIAMIVGLLTCVGVYSIAANAIKKGLEEKGITTLKSTAEDLVADANNYVEQAKGLVADANDSYEEITKILAQANKDPNDLLMSKLKSQQLADPNGFARVGDIMFSWGTVQSKSVSSSPELGGILSITTKMFPQFRFKYPFDTNCLAVIAVIPDVPGYVCERNKGGFSFRRTDLNKKYDPKRALCSYVAIGN